MFRQLNGISFAEASHGVALGNEFRFTLDRRPLRPGLGVAVDAAEDRTLSGNPVWSYPGVFSVTVGDCAGDAFGNTYLVHGGSIIKKVGPSGGLIWEHVYGLAGFRVEVGSDNRPIVSGFPNAGTPGAAFIKVDENGGLVWSNRDADGPLALLLHAQMLLDGANNAYLAAGTLFEMVLCKVNSDGTSGWTQTVAGSYANAIALGDNDSSVFVAGGMTARISQDAPPPPPSAPTNLTARVRGTKLLVNLAWTDNAITETGYTVERCSGSTL